MDTSAIVAAILNEPSHPILARKLFSERDRFCSSVTHVEAVIVLSRTGSDPRSVVDAISETIFQRPISVRHETEFGAAGDFANLLSIAKARGSGRPRRSAPAIIA